MCVSCDEFPLSRGRVLANRLDFLYMYTCKAIVSQNGRGVDELFEFIIYALTYYGKAPENVGYILLSTI